MTEPTPFDPEFDAVYSITASGVITPLTNLHAPDVMLFTAGDITISADWSYLSGYTQQQSYRGAVMHASEQWGQWAIDALTALAVDHGTVAFAVVEVRDEDGSLPDGDPIGWAVAYKLPEAPREHGEYADDEGTIGGDLQLSAAPGRRFVQQQVDGTYLVVSEAAYVIPGVEHTFSDDFDGERDGYAVQNMTEYVRCTDLEDVGGTELDREYTYDEVGYTTIATEVDALSVAQNFIRRLAVPSPAEMSITA